MPFLSLKEKSLKKMPLSLRAWLASYAYAMNVISVKKSARRISGPIEHPQTNYSAPWVNSKPRDYSRPAAANRISVKKEIMLRAAAPELYNVISCRGVAKRCLAYLVVSINCSPKWQHHYFNHYVYLYIYTASGIHYSSIHHTLMFHQGKEAIPAQLH